MRLLAIKHTDEQFDGDRTVWNAETSRHALVRRSLPDPPTLW